MASFQFDWKGATMITQQSSEPYNENGKNDMHHSTRPHIGGSMPPYGCKGEAMAFCTNAN